VLARAACRRSLCGEALESWHVRETDRTKRTHYDLPGSSADTSAS
jgi:hypothetical protein